jgi:Vacuolar protein sorting 55
VLAPVPNWVCGRCANPDDFASEGGGNAILDFGKFVTGFLVTMGIGGSLFSPLFCLAGLSALEWKFRALSLKPLMKP